MGIQRLLSQGWKVLKDGSLDGDGNDLTNVGSVSTEQLGSERHYVGAYDGGDPDARLDAALSAASNGDTVYLEKAEYDDARNISGAYNITGTLTDGGAADDAGTRITGDWTFDEACRIERVYFRGGTATLNATDTTMINCDFNSGITVSDNFVTLSQLSGFGSAVTFESGTSGGIIDTSTRLSVTDNGSNTVGDIA